MAAADVADALPTTLNDTQPPVGQTALKEPGVEDTKTDDTVAANDDDESQSAAPKDGDAALTDAVSEDAGVANEETRLEVEEDETATEALESNLEKSLENVPDAKSAQALENTSQSLIDLKEDLGKPKDADADTVTAARDEEDAASDGPAQSSETETAVSAKVGVAETIPMALEAEDVVPGAHSDSQEVVNESTEDAIPLPVADDAAPKEITEASSNSESQTSEVALEAVTVSMEAGGHELAEAELQTASISEPASQDALEENAEASAPTTVTSAEEAAPVEDTGFPSASEKPEPSEAEPEVATELPPASETDHAGIVVSESTVDVKETAADTTTTASDNAEPDQGITESTPHESQEAVADEPVKVPVSESSVATDVLPEEIPDVSVAPETETPNVESEPPAPQIEQAEAVIHSGPQHLVDEDDKDDIPTTSIQDPQSVNDIAQSSADTPESQAADAPVEDVAAHETAVETEAPESQPDPSVVEITASTEENDASSVPPESQVEETGPTPSDTEPAAKHEPEVTVDKAVDEANTEKPNPDTTDVAPVEEVAESSVVLDSQPSKDIAEAEDQPSPSETEQAAPTVAMHSPELEEATTVPSHAERTSEATTVSESQETEDVAAPIEVEDSGSSAADVAETSIIQNEPVATATESSKDDISEPLATSDTVHEKEPASSESQVDHVESGLTAEVITPALDIENVSPPVQPQPETTVDEKTEESVPEPTLSSEPTTMEELAETSVVSESYTPEVVAEIDAVDSAEEKSVPSAKALLEVTVDETIEVNAVSAVDTETSQAPDAESEGAVVSPEVEQSVPSVLEIGLSTEAQPEATVDETPKESEAETTIALETEPAEETGESLVTLDSQTPEVQPEIAIDPTEIKESAPSTLETGTEVEAQPQETADEIVKGTDAEPTTSSGAAEVLETSVVPEPEVVEVEAEETTDSAATATEGAPAAEIAELATAHDSADVEVGTEQAAPIAESEPPADVAVDTTAEDIAPNAVTSEEEESTISFHTQASGIESKDLPITADTDPAPIASGESDEPVPIEKEVIEVASVTPIIVTEDENLVGIDDDKQSSVQSAEIERPKSPWTPSYSVSKLGPDVAEEHQAEEAAVVEDNPPAENTSGQDTLAESQTISRPVSPWTPSYSVSRQGSPLPVTRPLADEPPAISLENDEQNDEDLSHDSVVGDDQATAEPITSVTEAQETVTTVAGDEVTAPSEEPDDIVENKDVASFTANGHPAVSVTAEENGMVQDAPEPEVEVPEQSIHVADASEPLADPESVTTEAAIPEVVPSVGLDIEEPVERPKSPWTPSYSVTSQGPNVISESDIPEIIELPPTTKEADNVPVIVEPAPQTESEKTAVEAETSHPSSPWTPSYSTSVQGRISDTEDNTDEKQEVSDGGQFAASRDDTQTYDKRESTSDRPTDAVRDGANEAIPVAAEAVSENPQDQKSADVAETDDVLSTVAPPVERPKSPWTPSYSVTQQGRAEEIVVDDHSGADSQASAQEPKDVPTVSVTNETSKSEVTEEPISRSEASQSDEATTDTVKAEPTIEPPASEDKGKVQEDKAAFPTSHDNDSQESLTSLDTVDPQESKSRARLESTTSSLFFPGGWFSKAPPAALNTSQGQGVFTSSKPNSPTHAPDKASPEDTAAAAKAHTQTAAEDKKSRWCIVM